MRRIICYVTAGILALTLLVSWAAQDGQCSESWTASFTVTSDDPVVDPISLTFGVDSNATDGFDAGLDQAAPPMPPEPIKLDAYFPCSHQFVKRLSMDIRQSADTVNWQLNARADSDGFALAWDTSSIPGDLDVAMSIGGSSVDMRVASSHHFNAGTYDLTITVSTPPTTGTINIVTNLPSAVFTLTGPATYSGGGTSWTEAQAPAGEYTITYGDVSGYITPPSEQKELSAGSTITFIGIYELISGERVELYLHPGWNLISLPLDPGIPGYGLTLVLALIQGSYNSVWAYDAALTHWKRYIPNGSGSLNDLTTVEPGRGYWIDMINGATLTIVGQQITETAISLHSGWNLVGYNCMTAQTRQRALASIAGVCSSVWTYDSATESWQRYVPSAPDFLNNLTQLEPGRGFWIYVEEDCSWIVSP